MDYSFFLCMIFAYAAGVVAALIDFKSKLGRTLVGGSAAIGAGAGMALGASVIGSGTPFSFILPNLIPIGGGFVLALDPLGAFFLILIGLVAVPVAIYSIGYTASYEEEPISLRFLGIMFNLFLFSMALVTMAGNVLTFLLMWEGMSLTSYFLVITENGEKSTLRAGLWYAGI